ncbi:hypothetical protein ON010_g4558 [Phytophthora cinnamomi]|nr:hypothetical protein ON010_g4558 [Phytophthora cinnamomi]
MIAKFVQHEGNQSLLILEEWNHAVGIVVQSGKQIAIFARWGDTPVLDWTHNTIRAGFYGGVEKKLRGDRGKLRGITDVNEQDTVWIQKTWPSTKGLAGNKAGTVGNTANEVVTRNWMRNQTAGVAGDIAVDVDSLAQTTTIAELDRRLLACAGVVPSRFGPTRTAGVSTLADTCQPRSTLPEIRRASGLRSQTPVLSTKGWTAAH